jgi:hypothetical protein
VVDGLGDNASPVNPDGTLRKNTPQAALMKSLTSEVITTYTRVMKKAALFHSLKKHPEEMAQYRRLKLPPLPADPEVPQHGKVAVTQSEYAFEANVMQLRTQHFSARREISHLFLWMYKMWEESFASKSFVDIELKNLSLPCNIAEFERIQSNKCKDTQG